MPTRYSASVTANVAADKPLIAVRNGSATNRVGVNEINVANMETPTETLSGYSLVRTATAGTGTAVTEVKLDPLSHDPTSVAQVAPFSLNPGYSAGVYLSLPFHNRFSLKWKAERGREFWTDPGSSNGGLGLVYDLAGAAPTKNFSGTMIWIE